MSSPLRRKISKISFEMLNDKLIVVFYFPENLQAILNRHIPVVTRSLTKIMSHLDDLQSVADYLELLGKIHHQSGIQVREINEKSYFSKFYGKVGVASACLGNFSISVIFYTEILTRKVVLWCFFMGETSEKIHNSTFQVKISV